MLFKQPETRRAPSSKTGLPWRFAGFLATSLLSKDALGTVFRALPLSEKAGGFVRLRIFDGLELPRERVATVFQALGGKRSLLPSPALVENARGGVHDQIGWIAWDESHGNALDRVLARPSREGRIPPEHALLIADRLALALEHAARAGESSAHGLVWPGLVTIGPAGDVRLGGFGIAPAVLPFLSAPSLSAELAPYLAPETREGSAGGALADVYSVGAVLLHLLSGRRPPSRAAADTLEPAGLYPPGAADVLRRALAPVTRRTASASLLRREIGGVLVSNRLQPSSRALSIFTASRMEEAASDGAVSEEAATISASPGEEDWELALSRLEPAPAGAARPRPRSSARAHVPLPTDPRDGRVLRRPGGSLPPR